jgi:single-stranded-DNA-specific exonuclease
MEDKIEQMYNSFFVNRGFGDTDFNWRESKEVEKFLNPDYEKDLIDPFTFRDMGKAIERIKKAIDNSEKILLYTDYDCDGIPGGVILYDFFNKLVSAKNIKNIKDKKEFNICFENYIPHRHKEGYGLHKNVLENYIKKGFTLMITADLGITNMEEIKYAEENGMNVILTDHHLPRYEEVSQASKTVSEEFPFKKEIIPPAYAVINTQLSYEKYQNKGICGAATAWKLVSAFLVKHGDEYGVVKGWEKWLLDMVALATVADLMPLNSENRSLVHYGLKVMQKSPRIGLHKMLKLAKTDQDGMIETDLSFTVAPRVNAAGRLDHPFTAFEALGFQNEKGLFAAEKLEKLNTERKSVVMDINKEVLEQILKDKNPIIFIGDKNFQVGVVGLIAQKATELTGKTSFVWGSDDGVVCRGSSRSGSDAFNVTDLVSNAKEFLLGFGGHEAAGGFAFYIKNTEKVKNILIKSVEGGKVLKIENKKEVANFVDMVVSARDINKKLFENIRKLAPFGVGNPAPILEISGERVTSRRFGKENNHTEIVVDGVSCIKFGTSVAEHEKLTSQKSWRGNIEKDGWKSGYRLKLL